MYALTRKLTCVRAAVPFGLFLMVLGTVKVLSPASPAFGEAPPAKSFAPRHPVTAEQIDEGMAFLKQQWPERYEKLERLRREDPDAFTLAYKNLWPQLSRMIDLIRRNPELAEVEMSLVRIEGDIQTALRKAGKAASPDEAEQSKAKLKELIGKRFDLDIQRTEMRIQELEERLVQQRQQLDARKQEREKRVEQITEEMMKNPPPAHGLLRGRRHDGLRHPGKGQPASRPAS